MPGKHNAGGCGCCGCQCGGSPLGTLYVEINDVAMNASPTLPECLGARFGQTFDETFFNGVTFVFDFSTPPYVTNPNAFDGGRQNDQQCVSQGGQWICVYEFAPLGGFNKTITMSMYVNLLVVSGKFNVWLTFAEYKATPAVSEESNLTLKFEYNNACPIGSYTEIARTYANAGAIDFRALTATLTWA